jgi:hypothetical protein
MHALRTGEPVANKVHIPFRNTGKLVFKFCLLICRIAPISEVFFLRSHFIMEEAVQYKNYNTIMHIQVAWFIIQI